MRPTIVLCLLAILCGIATADVKIAQTSEDRKKFDIVKALVQMKSKVARLAVLGIEQTRDLHFLIAFTHAAARDAFRTKAHAELNNTRAAVDDAIAHGKDAEKCFTTALDKFQKIQQQVEFQFTSCGNITLQDFSDNMDISTKLVNEGNGIITEITKTFSVCSDTFFTAQRCVTYWVKNCRLHVGSFRKKYHWYMTYRKDVFEKTSNLNFVCLRQNLEKGMRNIAKTKLKINACIDGLPSDISQNITVDDTVHSVEEVSTPEILYQLP